VGRDADLPEGARGQPAEPARNEDYPAVTAPQGYEEPAGHEPDGDGPLRPAPAQAPAASGGAEVAAPAPVPSHAPDAAALIAAADHPAAFPGTARAHTDKARALAWAWRHAASDGGAAEEAVGAGALSAPPVVRAVEVEDPGPVPPPGPGVLAALEAAAADPPAAAADPAWATAPEQPAPEEARDPFPWLTAAGLLAACEIARRQVLRAARESDAGEDAAGPLAGVPGLPAGDVP
jgi:hypothetical protein